MTSRLVKIPLLNANDDSAEFVKWECEDRAFVKSGESIALIETTKATMEIEAPVSGYCAHLASPGEHLAVGAVLAVILETSDQDPQAFLQQAIAPVQMESRRWTKKAEIVANKLGVDIEKLALQLGRPISEADVIGHNKPSAPDASCSRELVDGPHPSGRRERILLLGGGGGGGVITLDAIFRTSHQRAVGILDNNSGLHGKTLFGVPVLGSNEMAEELWKAGQFDAAIIVVTAKIEQREALYNDLKSKNIPLTNVIDPSVEIRANVQMGTGNLIMANGFIAACVSIGDNNFMASHICIEHHSKIGSHCTFGPRTTTSGAVTIGNRIKVGMGVNIEPYLTIGDGALLPSGCILTNSVPADSVVKMQSTQSIKPR